MQIISGEVITAVVYFRKPDLEKCFPRSKTQTIRKYFSDIRREKIDTWRYPILGFFLFWQTVQLLLYLL